ncbi:hypothetical protein B1H10_08180 [candidate division KSB1 bacterium 4484_188]|nr:MAG: hypothetical protein B1H10_08180 [candidate division KSB1 bacterium 4484_188]
MHITTSPKDITGRLIDTLTPIGKGQRGMIVSPPKAGKTTLLKTIARAVRQNHPEVTVFILLVDERPEEVTDFQRNLEGAVWAPMRWKFPGVFSARRGTWSTAAHLLCSLLF